jgi:hypothetical protein
MKKLKATIPDGGAPLGKFPVIRELFDDENKQAIEAILNSVLDGDTEGVILKGCVMSGTAGDFAISAGYIYADGEVLEYSGGSGFSATQYLKKGTVTEESGVFADGLSKAFIDVNVSEAYATTGGGSGTQYITMAFGTAGRTLKNSIGDVINDGVVTLSKMAVNSVDSDQYVDGSIDGIHLSSGAAEFNIGYNTAESQEGVTDLDNITRAGIFQPSSSATNAPVTSEFFDMVIQNGLTGGFISQVYIDFSTGIIHGRSKSGASAWTAWSSINT